VIDVDCADLQGFDSIDQEGLEQLAQMLGGCCDWGDLV
jgi:putative methionine-R-sulfoxide reductase with GAF domain